METKKIKIDKSKRNGNSCAENAEMLAFITETKMQFKPNQGYYAWLLENYLTPKAKSCPKSKFLTLTDNA